MTTFYSDNERILVAVDCIVFGYDTHEEDLKLLLFKRKVKPQIDMWSLIGDFVHHNEDVDFAATRVLKSFTGLENVFLKELKSFGKVNRDAGARVISIAFWSLIKLEEQKVNIVDSHGAKWFSIKDIPALVLDHDEMVKEAIKKLHLFTINYPIGKELLPELFTLPQLLSLYNAIYNKELDDRNFRRKILSTKMIVKQNHKDKSSSKRGAYYYKFNESKYAEFLEKGYHMEW